MKNEFAGKKIIIGVPNHFGLPERFKENLEFLGFEVFLLDLTHKNKLGLKDTLIHVSKKIFKKDRTHKTKRKAELLEKYHIDYLENIAKNIDYSLIIRPDFYSEKTIKMLKEKATLSVAYQWDGLGRFPLAKRYIELFDRFFVFDVRDIEEYPNCLPTTNFYFDDLIKENISETEKSIFFVGTYMSNRIKEIKSISEFFEKRFYKSKIYLHVSKKFNIPKKSYINYTQKSFSFKENLINLQKSDIILDFKNDIHYGLSFRTFEAIGYSKKLISNNNLVKAYDFYNPRNIFVLEGDYEMELEKFVKEPYQKLPKEIVEKYSFTNWLKYILNIDPHQKITLHYAEN